MRTYTTYTTTTEDARARADRQRKQKIADRRRAAANVGINRVLWAPRPYNPDIDDVF